MPNYDTLTEALEGLRKEGFTLDFNIAFDQLQCAANGACLKPDQFDIVGHHRFEGDSDPSDESVVYAITSHDGSMKGVLVSAYGIYSEKVSEDIIRKLQIHEY
jgi:hypothetical protein